MRVQMGLVRGPLPTLSDDVRRRQPVRVARHQFRECRPGVSGPAVHSKKHYAAPIGSKAAGAAFKDTWTLSDIDWAWPDEKGTTVAEFTARALGSFREEASPT